MSPHIDSSALGAAALLRGLRATDVFVFMPLVDERGFGPRSDVDIAVRASDVPRWPVDLVGLDDETPAVRYLVQSGKLILVSGSSHADGRAALPHPVLATVLAVGDFICSAATVTET